MVAWTPQRVSACLGERLQAKGKKITALFRDADADKSGIISYDEFRRMLASMHIVLTDTEMAAFVRAVDADGSGSINYREFLAEWGAELGGAADDRGVGQAVLSRRPTGERRRPLPPLPRWTPEMVGNAVGERLAARGRQVQRAFLLADADRSGALSVAEFRKLLAGMNIDVRS